MIKITGMPEGHRYGFTIAHRKGGQDAWVPVEIRTITLYFDTIREIADTMYELSKEGVTHFINDGRITFFCGDSPYCVLNANVQTLKVCAEHIETRLAKVIEVL